MKNSNENIALVGHPFAPTGRGEDVRCTFRSLRHASIKPKLVDIYELSIPDETEHLEFSHVCTKQSSEINIFHINADEVEQALTHLSFNQPWTGYNIIYPAWELANYPEQWGNELDKFDEIWAPSKFIYDSIKPACKKPVFHMPLACEVSLTSFLSRRYFGLPEDKYTFLFLFDIRSYIQRKNPLSIITAFRKLLKQRPYSKAHLVLKISGGASSPKDLLNFKDKLSDISNNVTIIEKSMSDNEIKNLLRNSDCFISLHRSEGFGRGMAEAMYLGKPVIATSFSGNMDFMNHETSLEVGYELTAVNNGEYPHAKNQTWANADTDQATNYMMTLVDNPGTGLSIGAKAGLHIHSKFGYQASGQKYLNRLNKIRLIK